MKRAAPQLNRRAALTSMGAIGIASIGGPHLRRAPPAVNQTDPRTGVMRHAGADDAIAIDCVSEQGLKLPMVDV